MDYIVVDGQISTLGTIEAKDASFSYEFIEFKNEKNGKIIQTDPVFVNEDIHALLKEGLSGKFVFTKSKKLTAIIGVKVGNKQATILDTVSPSSIKALKALKMMSTLGLLAAALGITHLLSEGWSTNGFLFAASSTLFTIFTVSQPILIEREKRKHALYLKEQGFDVTVVLRKMEPKD